MKILILDNFKKSILLIISTISKYNNIFFNKNLSKLNYNNKLS